MKKVLAGFAIAIAVAVIALIPLTAAPGHRSGVQAKAALTAGMVGFVGIDMDSSGNTATSLGAIQTCNTVAVNATLDIDVVVDAIDPADPFNAFQF
ncbi:MAG: hypothetical protein HYY03_09810, partial [Chloroflexi bacterium]|nr:hypothetical protein [Chloroflexota bacterium]